MSAVDIALRLVGAFYVFAGFVLARATLTSHVADRALTIHQFCQTDHSAGSSQSDCRQA